jgi:uncharacterized membrane protein YdjX (TVP38/TMEM64 family)
VRPHARPLPWKWIAAGATAVTLFATARLLPVKEWLEGFQGWVGSLGPLGGVLYGIVYVVAALLFVPGIVLTVGAGFLFGFFWGTVIVSAASTTAAALAFLIARYFARERVERLARKNRKFGAIDRAIGKNGWKVVALLRLSPLVPFSLSNYLYGLTSARFVPYLLASWIAMLPATFLYVSLGAAGKSLGQGRARSPWEWGLLAVGGAATVAVTVILTRVARKELAKTRLEEKES